MKILLVLPKKSQKLAIKLSHKALCHMKTRVSLKHPVTGCSSTDFYVSIFGSLTYGTKSFS